MQAGCWMLYAVCCMLYAIIARIGKKGQRQKADGNPPQVTREYNAIAFAPEKNFFSSLCWSEGRQGYFTLQYRRAFSRSFCV